MRVIFCRLPEKGRRAGRGDEREGQERKREMNESEETEEIKTFLRKTGLDISTTLIQGFNFTNSRFQLHEFTISTSRINDFNFTNSSSRIQLHEFTNST